MFEHGAESRALSRQFPPLRQCRARTNWATGLRSAVCVRRGLRAYLVREKGGRREIPEDSFDSQYQRFMMGTQLENLSKYLKQARILSRQKSGIVYCQKQAG